MDAAARTRFGVVGGGLMGLALARELAIRGHVVDVFEQDHQLGGLATHCNYGGFDWDRFYHVILPTDRNLIQFIQAIGLDDELRWRRTYTGFYVDEQLHSISSSLEFLKFPVLSLIDKARLAWTLLYSSRIDDWQRLETVPVEEWLIRVSGKRAYEKLWRPLLLAKLGETYKRVSAVFIWSYIKRLFSARDSSASKEQLGHVSGGYKMIFERLAAVIIGAEGSIRTGVTVKSINPGIDSGIEITIDAGNQKLSYDKVICTSPVPVLQRIAHSSLLNIRNGAQPIEYLGVVCVVVISSTPVVPFYVVNIADASIPFTGIIGMSSVVSEQYTNGRFITYLPKYVLSTDPWLKKSDEEIRSLFLTGLKKVVPEFNESDIESVHVNRAGQVQPLQVLNFSRHVPTVDTSHDDFFVLNTAQFLNATLNNNEVIGAVNRFIATHEKQLLV